MESVRLALVILFGLASLFAVASPVAAHIGVTPGLLVVGDTQTLRLSVHNDLDRPMTGLKVTAPDGVRIIRTGGEWQAVVENRTATWSGGPLAPNTDGTFELGVALEASTPVGPIQLQAEQLYPGGGSLPWPIPVTVIPGSATDEASPTASYVVALTLIGLLVLASIVALAWLKRRGGSSLQEE